MPFSAPSTYASQATTGYLATLLFGSPLAAVAEIKSIKLNTFSIPEVNVTHLLSPGSTEEIRPGLLKPGTITVSGNWIGDSSQLAILTQAKLNAAQNPPTQSFALDAPVQNGTKTYTVVGSCYVAKCEVGAFENNKANEFTMDLQVTGVVSESVT